MSDSKDTQPHSDDAAVDRFAARMKWKLAQARDKGRNGWQEPSWTPSQISQALIEHVAKGDPVDVANYCMFLADRNEPITPFFLTTNQPEILMNAPQPITTLAQQDIGGPPALGEYWPGQGGLFVGSIPAMHGLPARHLIAAVEEIKLTWGPYGHKVPGADSRIDGPANTAALLADKAVNGSNYPAAEHCAAYTADGHADFHLPSQACLFMASLFAPQVFSKASWYWSSSQGDSYYAFVQVFEYGHSYWGGKGSEYFVRPLRWIQL